VGMVLDHSVTFAANSGSCDVASTSSFARRIVKIPIQCLGLVEENSPVLEQSV
jgi:hypothetical protein